MSPTILQSGVGNRSMRCEHCAADIICIPAFHLGGPMIYMGSCAVPNCSDRCVQYLCSWCFDHSSDNSASMRGRGGGRTVGVYSSIKSVKNHFTTKTHKLVAMEHNQPGNNQDAVIENEDVSGRQSTLVNYLQSNDQPGNNLDAVIDNEDVSGRQSTLVDYLRSNGFASGSKSPEYYAFLRENEGKGAQFLTAKAFQVDVKEVSLEESRYSLLIANLLCQLTKAQQKLLAEVLLFATNAKDLKHSIFKATRVPTSLEDFDDIYIKGADSILCNLPIPVAQLTNDNTHAYVTLTDVLANEMAAGTSFDRFYFDATIKLENLGTLPTTISNTPSAYHLFCEMNEESSEEGTYILYLWLKEWRDDFDPNNTKASRNQVWINTYTICPSSHEKRGRNTYFMAISSKGEDHSVVEMLFEQELTNLSTQGAQFYHGGKKEIIRVKVGRLITCVDRPERTSMYQIGDHGGSFSMNFGYAGSVDGSCKENHLPSCPFCRKKRVKQYVNDHDFITHDDCDSNNGCGQNKCSDWNVMNEFFSFPVPKFYPTKCDQREGAPLPPSGRGVIQEGVACNNKRQRASEVASLQRLATVELSIEWLKEAVLFAFHNIKTLQPEVPNRVRAYYWTKGNLTAYLRTCGVTLKVIDDVFTASRSEAVIPPFPVTWNDKNALKKCHYAAMHMLFLGHTKSNFDMAAAWLATNGINATFGKQANNYLSLVQRLRSPKYFNAHTLSQSTWATGTWVSENYVFWARTQKFWYLLPCIMNSKNKDKPKFMTEVRMIHRFAAAAQSAMSLLMSMERKICRMGTVIKIYMDAMRELDDWIDKSDKKRKQPNFVKSNSLGILSAADSHHYLGPAVLHWEGGYGGERKIQEVKPLLSIKRENANWQQITLRRLYQLDTIAKLLENIPGDDFSAEKTREHEGLMKIYPKPNNLREAVANCLPLSGVLDVANRIWLACRPSGGASRSSVMLVEILFDDENGHDVGNICWMAPIKIGSSSKQFSSMSEVLTYSGQFVLLLPSLSKNGEDFKNEYYTVGSKWSERTRSGVFQAYGLNEFILNDWIQTPPLHREAASDTQTTNNPTAQPL